MDKLIELLTSDHPGLKFRPGKQFYWSPADQTVIYNTGASGARAIYSLLHETGHARLGHERYKLDFELLQLEVSAWEEAKRLAAKYGLEINEDHIQDCLDSYRDWLYRRSICPSCTTKALQQDNSPQYRCYNCHATWKVSPSRFCRPYRQSHSRAEFLVATA
jgi:hypothetical protein